MLFVVDSGPRDCESGGDDRDARPAAVDVDHGVLGEGSIVATARSRE
jgi:hypothetical protein